MANTNLPVHGLNVPTLTDNTVWFANAASWNNYWLNATFTVVAPIADTTDYGLVKTAITTIYAPAALPVSKAYSYNIDPNGDGNFINTTVADAAYVDAILARLLALDATVQQMRTAMVNAGLINNAQ